MRRSTKFAAAVAAGGTIALGAALAVPALAGNGPGPANRPASVSQMQGHHGNGAGNGPGTCTCQAGSTAAVGTLTSSQQETLAAMAQQEKLSHDLYTALAARYDAVVFDRIAAAETNHLAAVRTLLARYGLSDPTAGKAAGVFSSADVQATYDRLLAQGKASQDAALQVGQTVERDNIAALTKGLDGLTAANVRQVYTNLLRASEMHLTAFGNWLSR